MALRFFLYLLAGLIVLERNLEWHRKIIVISIPLFVLFVIGQTEYTVCRLKKAISNEIAKHGEFYAEK